MKIGRNDHHQQPIAQRRTDGAGAAQGARGPDPRSNAVASQKARGLVMSGKLPIDTGAITDAILREER